MTFDILLSAPDTGTLEESYVLAALRSGWVAPAGPDLECFEREVAERLDVAHAVALSSGTAALHLALISWGVGQGDVIPVSTLTFAATVNAIRYVGATPFFIDSEGESGNMSVELLMKALEELHSSGRRVPAVIVVDLLGKPAELNRVEHVLRGYPGTRLLSDAAESFGSNFDGRPSGSFGEAAVLSFNGNKMITTSGGGMLTTADPDLAAHVRKLATQAREPVPHYQHEEIGYNYRLSNICAAIGRAQLRRLQGMLERRRAWRERYRQLFASEPGVRILGGDADDQDNCWLTAIVTDPSISPWSAPQLGEALGLNRIETRPIWKPMHLQPVNREFGGMLDGTAERLFDNGLALPSGSCLTETAFDSIEDEIQRFLRTWGGRSNFEGANAHDSSPPHEKRRSADA